MRFYHLAVADLERPQSHPRQPSPALILPRWRLLPLWAGDSVGGRVERGSHGRDDQMFSIYFNTLDPSNSIQLLKLSMNGYIMCQV